MDVPRGQRALPLEGRGGEGRGGEERREGGGGGGLVCGREEGRGVERRAEVRVRRREEGEGRAEESSNSWKSSHWPSFVVRSVLLWKVYLPENFFSDFQFLTVSQVGHGGGHWCTFDQQAGVGVRHGSKCTLSQWTSSLHQNPCA